MLIATASTVVLVALIVIGLVKRARLAPGAADLLRCLLRLAMLPEIAQGRWLNVPLMAVCEIGILILAMIVALVRSLRGPVFFPLRGGDNLRRSPARWTPNSNSISDGWFTSARGGGARPARRPEVPGHDDDRGHP